MSLQAKEMHYLFDLPPLISKLRSSTDIMFSALLICLTSTIPHVVRDLLEMCASLRVHASLILADFHFTVIQKQNDVNEKDNFQS
jgi:hypothetical protein